jgi:Alcohol dehydrogenase GroES-like domain
MTRRRSSAKGRFSTKRCSADRKARNSVSQGPSSAGASRTALFRMSLSNVSPSNSASRLSIGEPADELHLEEVAIPSPRVDRIRVRVHACALDPADWAVCKGFFPALPSRGIGFDVSGTVDAVGEGVTGVHIGDLVFGVPDYMGYLTAGRRILRSSPSGRPSQKVSTWSKPPRCRRPSKRPRAVSIFSDWHRAKRFWSTAGGRRPDSQPFRSHCYAAHM